MPRKVILDRIDPDDELFEKRVKIERNLNNKGFCYNCHCFAKDGYICNTLDKLNRCSKWKKINYVYLKQCTFCTKPYNNYFALAGHMSMCDKNPKQILNKKNRYAHAKQYTPEQRRLIYNAYFVQYNKTHKYVKKLKKINVIKVKVSIDSKEDFDFNIY